MKHLYYVRHGQSQINIDDFFATKPGTPLDKGLTDTGREQATNGIQAAKAQNLHFDVIVCSPLQRAKETARMYADAFGYPPKDILYSELFLEIQSGALEGTSWSAFWESGKTYKNLGEFEGAETIEALQQRAQKALAYLESLPYESILVVAHSCFGRALRRVIENQPYTYEFTMPEEGKSLPFGQALELL